MKFEELNSITRRGQKDWVPPHRLLAIDPGETIGWSLFVDGIMVEEGQIEAQTREGKKVVYSKPEKGILELFKATRPTYVVCEDYRVYGQKADTHIGMDLFTPKMIGMISYCCYLSLIPIDYQMATLAKGWVKDEKLKEWGYYITGHKHSRDSIRHGAYWLLFNKRKIKKEVNHENTKS